MNNKILFTLIHLFSLYFTLEEYPLWFTLSGLAINLLSFFPLKHKKIISQFGVIIIAYLHFSFYRKLFDPESASALLSNMLYLKYFMLKDKEEFERNVILSFLNLACLSLFNSNIFFITFLLVASFLLMKLLNKNPEDKFQVNIKSIALPQNLRIFLYGLPIAVLLFFIFPRLPNFFPVAGTTSSGKIGYSKDIDNTAISELQTSSQVAFRATIKKLSQNDLYWRGRILNQTNGYNWRFVPHTTKRQDKSSRKSHFNYSIKSEQSFEGDIILLDSPVDIVSNFRTELNEGYFFTSYRSRQKITYSAISSLGGLLSGSPNESYLKVPAYVPNALKTVLQNFDKSLSLEENVNRFQTYILKNEYSYTLSPGPLPTLQAFLEVKKGFCTHYASLMALVFRHLGFPTRVVSGFQGGEYNEIGGYYTVRSNDAHAWVEIFSNKKWMRFDPTAFISPLRIELGGDGFVNQEVLGTNVENFFGKEIKTSTLYTSYYNFKQWLDNLNYQVALFIESFDIEKQKELYDSLLSYMKKNKTLIIYLGLSLILLISFIFILPIKNLLLSKDERLLKNFNKKIKKKYKRSFSSYESFHDFISGIECSEEEKARLRSWTSSYQKLRYSKLTKNEKRNLRFELKNFY